MKLKLHVKYEEKEEAKKLGAKWDSKRKTWYIPLPEELKNFSKWIDNSLLIIDENAKENEHTQPCDSKPDNNANELKLFMEVREGYPCCKCGKGMNILQPFSKRPKNMAHTKPHEYALIWHKPASYVEFAKSLDVKMDFRTTSIIKTPYALHICPNCGQVQGDFYIFEDKDCRLPVKQSFEVLYSPDKDEWKIL